MLKIPLNPLRRALNLLLISITAAFAALHYVHLRADFPNNSPWMDWSKYTDEGWYGDAAIRFFQLGHWNVPGDFNPAAALPVWPLLEGLVFWRTGVSLVAARALVVTVFLGILVATWFLVERTSSQVWSQRGSSATDREKAAPSFAASTGVLLLAVSPFCFVFSRLAILEPPMVLFMLLALLAATTATAAPDPKLSILAATVEVLRRNLSPIILLGVLIPTLILTKTTALFLFPAIFWMLFAALGFRTKPLLIVGSAVCLIAACLWLAYFLLVVRPHFLVDYRYLFSANSYTGITRATFVETISTTLTSGTWVGKALYPLAALAAAVTLFDWRRLRTQPLIPALLLWIGGYLFFLAYHNNMQPRYYFVIAVPVLLMAPVTGEDWLMHHWKQRPRIASAICIAAVVSLGAIAATEAFQTIGYIRHPEYTLVDAAHQVAGYIADDRKQDPGQSPLVLSISGSDLSLMTGLPSICDDFGTLELVDRVRRYRPGWYLAWNAIEDDKMDALTRLYDVQRVAVFPAMDDPDRNLLVLYKLVPTEDEVDVESGVHHFTPRHSRRKPLPFGIAPRSLGQKPAKKPVTTQP